ncbi:MAG: NAD(P)H-binding protein [Actinophytocola sp.]|uniref:NAD(P)-dependent oxidoreductase n=1 Tax=Actinophytocola sp. TaxID=1872138 RepID=UPI001325D36C|nr:NAD(P)H-binding protein [Actinophytocola sp.]MPZ80675.1 NAD(P)H-binding protein [Actinophytocola sp.]
MKLTVFGATGGIGGHIVRQALDAGHTVTAVVRDRSRLDIADHPALTVVTVSGLTDSEPLEPLLLGSDAALSGVGARSLKDVGVAATATRGILGALEATGVRRFVAVSAMPVGPIPDGEGFLGRRVAYPLVRRFLRKVYDDLAEMEADIRRSGTEWTVMRPPRLTDKPVSGTYRLAIGANVPNGNFVSRADVAHAMLALLDNPASVDQPVGVAL